MSKRSALLAMRNLGPDNGCSVFSDSKHPVSSFVRSRITTRPPVFRFNNYIVCFGVNQREMKLTRTCCFEFDRMLRADSKRVLLSTFCFYFMVACFTHRSLHPEVDNIIRNTERDFRGDIYSPRPSIVTEPEG